MACLKACLTEDPTDSDVRRNDPIVNILNLTIAPGSTFFVSGELSENGNEFSVEFHVDNPDHDIAYRLSATVSPHSLKRNSYINGAWGAVESNIPSWFHIPTSTNFKMQFFFGKESISVAFDEKHVASYQHRVDYRLIRVVKITGDLTNVIYNRKELLSYPERTENTPSEERSLNPSVQPSTSSSRKSGTKGAAAGGFQEQPAGSIQKLLPFFYEFGPSFKHGCAMVIKCRATSQPKMFKIAIQRGQNIQPQPLTSLNIVFNFPETQDAEAETDVTKPPIISFNCYNELQWSKEVHVTMTTGFPRNQTFNIVIMRALRAYRIRWDHGELYEYPCTVSTECMDTCYIDGDIKLVDFFIEQTNFFEFDDVIKDGHVFLISGPFSAVGEKFIIDFCLDNEDKDIALRMTIRVSTNSLARNSRIKGIWGVEELSLPNGFQLDKTRDFDFQVYFKDDTISIALDHQHIQHYVHRLPFNSIRSIEVRGDILYVNCERRTTDLYPIQHITIANILQMRDRNRRTANTVEQQWGAVGGTPRANRPEFLRLPYYALLPQESFDSRWTMTVTGRAPPNAKIFKVILQSGWTRDPRPNIALQLEFNFTQIFNPQTEAIISKCRVVTLNTFNNLQWQEKVQVMMESELRSGVNFNLFIARCEQWYQVRLNNEHIYDYRYIVSPESVDICLINGNIELRDVVIEKD